MAKKLKANQSSEKKARKRPIEQFEHAETRANNPPVGLVTPETDPDAGRRTYQYDPHLDPQLVWAGKAEHTSFEVPTVSLHVHERIDPKTIIQAVRKINGNGNGGGLGAGGGGLRQQGLLFERAEENPPIRDAVEFYRHQHNWSNRLVAGDSLLVMNSLLEKEGLAGKVQMVYLDPPYGIRYGSNFQPFVNRRDVKDGRDEDLTQEPETIRAFRDTWELGIHSYLTYLRDRLELARELLHESGSIFVQISDENLHHVRGVLDEVFGSNNFEALITFRKTSITFATVRLGGVCDYVLWYSKHSEQKQYIPLYIEKTLGGEGGTNYGFVELPDGTRRRLTSAERSNPGALPKNARVFSTENLISSGRTETCVFDFEFDGNTYSPSKNKSWKTNRDGMAKLAQANRLLALGDRLYFVTYFDEYPITKLTNAWYDTRGEMDRTFVVQTATNPIARCMLMTTKPGELVFDPTCGSGTTAYVAEQWGRRWITCDTSRVAVTLAKQRLMTATFDYYQLAHPEEGVGSGFVYKTVPHVTLGSIANNPEIKPGMTRAAIDAAIAKYADQETLYDQPLADRSKARVTGPFTVEAVPAASVLPLDSGQLLVDSGQKEPPTTNNYPLTTDISRSGETVRQAEWRDELLKTGIRGRGGQRIEFSRVEVLGGTRWLHADAETKGSGSFSSERSPSPKTSTEKVPDPLAPQRAVISFGPEHAPLEQRQVARALDEAETLRPKPKLVIFAAFQFDPEAAKDVDETNWPGVTLLKAQMNADLLTDDLKKKRTSNDSYWLIGQPDVEVNSEQWIVNSKKEALGPYDVLAKLSGLDRLAEVDGLGRDDLSVFVAIAQRRDLWLALATDASGGVDTGKHRRGSSEARDGGISPVPGNSSRFPGRIGDAGNFVRELEVLSPRDRDQRIERMRRSREIIDLARQIAPSLTAPLSTIHYSQITIHGFDYYNTRTGAIESGDTTKIAMWLLDTDYDGRSLYPRQVFFPLSGEKDGWSRLAKNLKAEIDDELIEQYRGTASLPFAAGDHSRVAVKIVDDRGIESLRIVGLG